MPDENTTRGAIIVYRLGPGPRGRVSRFVEQVLGQDRKRNGKMYRRRGLLDDVPHWKVGIGIVIVQRKDQRKVVQEIRRWTGQVHTWSVTLTQKQARLLTIPSR